MLIDRFSRSLCDVQGAAQIAVAAAVGYFGLYYLGRRVPMTPFAVDATKPLDDLCVVDAEFENQRDGGLVRPQPQQRCPYNETFCVHKLVAPRPPATIADMDAQDRSHRRAMWLIVGLLLVAIIGVVGFEANWVRERRVAWAEWDRIPISIARPLNLPARDQSSRQARNAAV